MTHLHLALAVLPLVFPADRPPEVYALLYVAKPTNGREPAVVLERAEVTK